MKTETKLSYYTMNDIVDISNAKTLKKLVDIALVVIERMPRPLYWVAGPITSGPKTVEKNRKRLRNAILYFKIKGAITLNYLPLQKQALKILRREFGNKKLSKTDEREIQEILRDELYAPIFSKSGRIGGLLIMPHSEKSLNVQWMKGFACAHNIPIKDISEQFVF